jgi:hypothetical protein
MDSICDMQKQYFLKTTLLERGKVCIGYVQALDIKVAGEGDP